MKIEAGEKRGGRGGRRWEFLFPLNFLVDIVAGMDFRLDLSNL